MEDVLPIKNLKRKEKKLFHDVMRRELCSVMVIIIFLENTEEKGKKGYYFF